MLKPARRRQRLLNLLVTDLVQVALAVWFFSMPRYHFDLVDGEIVADHGGLLLRDDPHAFEVGERLAKKLFESRPELRGRQCTIRVRGQGGSELYRALIEE
jgi:hypothetical protein